MAFAHELARLGLPVRTLYVSSVRREWREQLDAALAWALAGG
ncbi:MAG TPA: hypothetical protein VGC78_11485 [Gaiellaceae bacterium]|jgi:hypothetical protein